MLLHRERGVFVRLPLHKNPVHLSADVTSTYYCWFFYTKRLLRFVGLFSRTVLSSQAQPGGAVGAPAPPGRRKFFRRNSQGKFVSAPPAHQVHPPGGARVNCQDIFLLCQEDLQLELVVLDRLLEATTKKGRQLFEDKSGTVF